MISCGLDMLDLILLVENFMKLIDKFYSSISGNLLWGLESADDFSVQEIGN